MSYIKWWSDLIKYHFDNLYGMESDPKTHEIYWHNTLYDSNKKELKVMCEELLDKAGSFNSNEIGKLNAVISLLKEKYNEEYKNGRRNIEV